MSTSPTTESTRNARSFRFSGHETFACRYAWLPKAYRALAENPHVFSDDDAAMVQFGLGKNMVRSLRFWVDAVGLATPSGDRGLELTAFAHAVFAKGGVDPYLEDIRTLWLLHWNLASRSEGALFAWHFLLNQWPYPDFTRSEALAAFSRESSRLGHEHSTVTLSQHFDVFIHTYHPTRAASAAVEDSLDGPLVSLGLLQDVGQRRADSGRWETVFAFRREAKPEVTDALFDYCVDDFWTRFRSSEQTLSYQELSQGTSSPGRVFRLPDEDLRERLDAYTRQAERPFSYQVSALQGLLSRRRTVGAVTLSDVYATGGSHV